MDATLEQSTAWMLVEHRTDDASPARIAISTSTITVGRTNQAGIVLNSTVVSKIHASITVIEGKLIVQDLQSTNGTFVNEKRIEACEVREGDVIRFANVTFNVTSAAAGAENDALSNQAINEATVPWTAALLNFEELMDPGGVVAHFQPIVRLADGQRIGFESLARSDLEQLKNPKQMFQAAGEVGQEQALSELMRRTSIRGASGLGGNPGVVFLNTHPAEGFSERLERSLRELRLSAPHLNLAIEIKEEIAQARESMVRFRKLLHELGMQLVIDDFGSDPSRLDDLLDTPPDYLKFDRKLIRNIHSSSDRQRELVKSLLDAVHRLGAKSVAVGVETEEEAHCCQQLGFELAQGFYYGRPDSIAALVEAAAESMGSVKALSTTS